MQSDINFKELWQGQQIATPNEEEVLKRAQKFKRKSSLIMLTGLLALILTALFFTYMAFTTTFDSLNQKIGFTIIFIDVILCIVLFMVIIVLQSKQIESDTQSYLQHLVKVKKQANFINTELMAAHFILLSIGFAFFLFGNALSNIIAYVLTFGWFAFCWFIMRPFLAKRGKQKINTLIEQLESIQEDLRVS